MIDEVWWPDSLVYDLANKIEKSNYSKLKILHLLQNETTVRESQLL